MYLFIHLESLLFLQQKHRVMICRLVATFVRYFTLELDSTSLDLYNNIHSVEGMCIYIYSNMDRLRVSFNVGRLPTRF